MMYEVRNNHGVTMHIDGKRSWQFLSHAKLFAEELCNSSNRKEHYEVVKIEGVYITSTLEEALKG